MKPRPLNTTGLAALRAAAARENGQLRCDGSTANGLVTRGYAGEIGTGVFITKAGIERARKRADVVSTGTANVQPDPSLLLDLCPECDAPTDRPLCPDCQGIQTAMTDGMIAQAKQGGME